MKITSGLILLIMCVCLVSVECFFRPNVQVFTNLKGKDPGRPLYLTPLIESGKIFKAQHLSKVKPDIGNTTSYSGYITTNKKCGNNLFFWFFLAQQDWETAPLVLWLQGGPGMSSMFGLFEELGPFNSFPEGLQTRKYSWNIKNNLLFIDQPVGTGYSFTNDECYAKNQTDVGDNLYEALVQFLKLFPNLQMNNFFITGESYAGHYVPTIGYTIHNNNPSAELKINLKGMMIGDVWTDPVSQINYGDYLYQIGLIDDTQREEFHYYQNLLITQVNSQEWLDAYKSWHIIIGLFKNYTGLSAYNYLPQPPDKSNWVEFIQLPSTRRAIHVGSTSFNVQSAQAHDHLIEDMMQSVKPQVEVLLDNNYPIVFYVGQVDVICAYPMVINFLRSLNWTGQHLYLNATRCKWSEGNDIAGYVKGQHLLFDVLVRGSGHMVPSDKPFWSYQLINAFTMGNGNGSEFLYQLC